MRNSLVRPLIERLKPYVPGEQIIVEGLVRLNTNENPYAPAPEVLDAVKAAVDARLRRYPSASADGLRAKLAQLHGCKPENIIVGNGSDEILELAVRTFVDPLPEGAAPAETARYTCQFFDPSYSLYPVLTEAAGSLNNPVPLAEDFGIPSAEELRRGGKWDFNAALTFVTTPNAPTGRGYTRAELEALCKVQNGVVILDEAYSDFAEEDAMELALRLPNTIVARTFSKAYCLCFQRVGYAVGPVELIGAMHKIRGSYNVNGLGQVAAEATLDHLDYYRANFERVKKTRSETLRWLAERGFGTTPSRSNFIFVKPPGIPAQEWYKRLRDQRVLVRWWNIPNVKDHLRISIGSEEEMVRFREVVTAVLNDINN